MDVEMFCSLIGVKYVKRLNKCHKLRQLVDYVNESQIELYHTDKKLSEKALLEFLEEISSVEVAIQVLKEVRNYPELEREPQGVAKFFNIYHNVVSYYPGSWMNELICNKEYLKRASLEWTRDHILDGSFDKVLVVCKNNSLRVKPNVLSDENEDTYEPSFYTNVDSLKSCLKEDKLDKAIELLSK